MSNTGSAREIAKRYALALLDLAEGNKELDKVAEDLASFKSFIKENSEFDRMLHSPVVGQASQMNVLNIIMDKGKPCGTTQKFIGYLGKVNRLAILEMAIAQYLEILAERRGEIVAEVISAHPLAATERKELEKVIRGMAGEKSKVSYEENSELIGGFIVKIGSRMIDASLGNQLQKLSTIMKGA